MNTDGACDRDGSVLDYCRLNDITIQAWSPFQYGFFEGVFTITLYLLLRSSKAVCEPIYPAPPASKILLIFSPVITDFFYYTLFFLNRQGKL